MIIQGAILKYNVQVSKLDRGIANASYAPNGRIIINSGRIESGDVAVLNTGGIGNTRETAAITISGDNTYIKSRYTVGLLNYAGGFTWIENGVIYGISATNWGQYNIPQGYRRVDTTETIDGVEYVKTYFVKD